MYDNNGDKNKKRKSLLLSSTAIALVLATMTALAPLASQQQSVLAQTSGNTTAGTTGMLPTMAEYSLENGSRYIYIHLQVARTFII